MILLKPLRYLLFLLIISFFSSGVLTAQSTDDPEANQEYRGAWIASVINLDWPISKNASTDNQKLQMLSIFDSLQESGFNAVYLQVRTEADALYDSEHAPWSYYLTGERAQRPSLTTTRLNLPFERRISGGWSCMHG